MALVMGCSKEDDPQSQPNISIDNEDIETKCKSFGIFPKDIANITSIDLMADSVSYKLAGGRKGNKSWFAKFSPNGTELYSYSLAPNIAQKEYAYINPGSLWDLWVNEENKVYKDSDKLFLITWFENKNKTSLDDYNSVLSVLDFETGKELSILPFEYSIDRYKIIRSNDTYYILSGRSSYKHLYCLNSNGGLEWYRETTKNEKESGLLSYKDYQALDNRLMLFFSSKVINGFSEKIVKIIDLEAYMQKLEILCSDIPFVGDLSTEKNVLYEFHKAEKQNDNIILYFGEYLGKDIIDDAITDNHHTEYELKNEYYYIIAYPSGDVLGKYKKHTAFSFKL